MSPTLLNELIEILNLSTEETFNFITDQIQNTSYRIYILEIDPQNAPFIAKLEQELKEWKKAQEDIQKRF